MSIPALHELLYFSVLAPNQTPTVVGQIAAQARRRNTERDITGLLVFDGIHFCQHIEGPRDAVLTLLERLQQDARHTDLRVVYESARTERRYRRFDLGFAQSDGAEDMASIQSLDGDAALQRFLALQPGFDVHG
ncbi:BLUF domain-containing protein [Variovorax sp. LT1R16]|uniref:BLUF domain-containing protein n=1 Tax=Variovorax sp. LT1R16 TaxID=3443728 RepID=UPI003F45C69F